MRGVFGHAPLAPEEQLVLLRAGGREGVSQTSASSLGNGKAGWDSREAEAVHWALNSGSKK